MYNWGYLKNVILSKLDLDTDEAEKLGYTNRFVYYANEAITQISSAVKPKRTFCELDIHRERINADGQVEISNVGTPIRMPEDFISFGDDINTILEDIGFGDVMLRKACDEDFRYYGNNKVICYSEGKYQISYNARWIDFSEVGDDELDVPTDILECIPSYVASQCLKVDDDYKSTVLRNEYETFLARIDDVDFKSNNTFTIGGDW